MRFLRDVQKPCRRASLITGALIGEPGGVCFLGLLRSISGFLNWTQRQGAQRACY